MLSLLLDAFVGLVFSSSCILYRILSLDRPWRLAVPQESANLKPIVSTATNAADKKNAAKMTMTRVMHDNTGWSASRQISSVRWRNSNRHNRQTPTRPRHQPPRLQDQLPRKATLTLRSFEPRVPKITNEFHTHLPTLSTIRQISTLNIFLGRTAFSRPSAFSVLFTPPLNPHGNYPAPSEDVS